MRKQILILGFLLAVAASGWAQTAPDQKPHKIFGYVDEKTGTFQPLGHSHRGALLPPGVSPTTGTFIFNVTITVSSALPASATIDCFVAGGVEDALTGAFANEAGIVAKRSGNTATCTVKLPYSWELGDASADSVKLDLEVVALVGTIGSAEFSDEEFQAPVLTMKVPANGTTTTEDINTTI